MTYSNATLFEYIRQSPRLAPSSSVFLLSTNLIAKHYEPELVGDSIRATEVARALGIRVPSIKRKIEANSNAYCVMERIEGVTLEEAWTKLSWVMTVKLALELRRYVYLLRSLTSSTAGSIESGECRSFWLEDRYQLPARSSPEHITYFIKFWLGFASIRRAREIAAQSSAHPLNRYIPPTSNRLVFTHHDLAPRNIILDTSGKLWLLDWDYAGWYPIYFEYASMQNFLIPESWTPFARMRWYLFTWITVGRFKKDRRVLEEIRTKFTRFSVGRRFDILKNGTPSRYHVS